MRELSLNVLDVAQNSITAGSKITEIIVEEYIDDDRLVISINDTGKGMTQQQISNVIDPFFTTRTTRKIGLGVPLFKMAAEMTGGNFKISSILGEGTKVRAEFIPSSVDMTPLGDINSTISLLIRCNPHLDFVFTHKVNDKSFTLDTRELRDILGEEVPLDSADVMAWIDGYLEEQIQIIIGGKTNEIIS